MSQATTHTVAFATRPLPLEVSFDGGRLTSDGGLPWLAEADAALGMCEGFAACLPDWRRGPVRHTLSTLIRQRVFQIACGYEDQDDADTLRCDPLLKLVCGRLPETGADLASQPTLSRLENAVDARAGVRLAYALLELYLRERGRAGRPTRILLDFDGTADPTHGDQEGSAYHGYFRQHMYHPLLVFDGDTNQLITAVLRPGTAHGGRGTVAILRRLVHAIRARWPDLPIELRADSAFSGPALYAYCDRARIHFTVGIAPNSRLAMLAAETLAEAQRQQAESGAKVRLAGEASYQAESWHRARRVVYKAEVLPKGPNTRFVVTSHTDDDPLARYDFYVDRGEPELWIKDFKRACFADRLSCHRFLANQFRLLLHAAAYWLLDTLRRWLLARAIPRMQLDTLRLRLLKVGGRVVQLASRVRLRLASSHPSEPLWQLLAAPPRPL